MFRTCDLHLYTWKAWIRLAYSVVNVDLVKSCFYPIICSQNELAYLQFCFELVLTFFHCERALREYLRRKVIFQVGFCACNLDRITFP